MSRHTLSGAHYSKGQYDSTTVRVYTIYKKKIQKLQKVQNVNYGIYTYYKIKFGCSIIIFGLLQQTIKLFESVLALLFYFV